MYYVYEWFIKDTEEVIYVGKGIHRRYKVRKHNKLFNEMIRRFDCESRIVKEFDTEKEAFSYEYERIRELKEIGQCVCNIYDGGFGGTTEIWTDDKRKWYSEHNTMKSEIQRSRMSKNNPMKDPEIAERVGKTKARAVVIGDRTFESVKDAMSYYHTSFETIQTWCKKGVNQSGEHCRYKDEEQKEYTGRYNKGGCRAIIYNGKRYESGIDIARELGVSNTVVWQWAQKGFTPDGTPCRYEDETRNLEYKKQIKGSWNKKPVIVNGIRYSSRRDAEDSLGLKHGYLAPYMNGTRKNTKYICEYDNQQPSRGNTDESTPEGSTTNG